MYENLSSTNINFYNYILSKQNSLNTQTNFSNSNFNLFKNTKSLNQSEIQNYKNLHQSNKAIKNIKVNKLNSNDISLKSINSIYFKTNRDFYHSKPLNKRNKSSNYFLDDYNTINYTNINNINNINSTLFPYNKHKRTKSDFIFLNNNFINKTNNDENIYSKFNTIRDNIINNLITTENNNNNKETEEDIYNFKNMKMFYAHLELLLSLYLKRYFKFFIQRIKQYEKIKNIVNVNLYNALNNNNNNQPIINLNNAHCSLYCSININKDNNEIFDTNNNINNNNINQNSKILNKNNKNHFCSMKDIKNKNIYVPKNKSKNLKQNKSKVFMTKDKNKINNNNMKKSSPIKEMNIDLKKMNINQNKIKNQRAINSKNEKNKLKISNSKSNIYKRPKDSNNTTKNIIKEIKIQNKELILTPYENKNKKFFDTIYSYQQSPINKENNNIKKIYIRKNNSNEMDNIKTNLFRNKSNLSFLKSFSDYIQYKQKETLIKKIITADKRIFININYINIDSFLGNNNNNKNSIYSLLKIENTLSLTIIKNTLLIMDNINQNMILSDIFIFDNDKNNNLNYNKISKAYFNEIQNTKDNNCKNKIDIFKFSNVIKDIIIINIRKYLLNKFKKDIHLRKLISIKTKKILNYYFKKFLHNKNNNSIKSGIYHKINYNDDFNLNKKVKSPMSIKNNNNYHWKINAFSLNSKNNNILYRNKNKKNKNQIQQSSTNYSHNYKYWNKEFNITVHENKNNNNNNCNKKKNINSYTNKNKK